MNTKHIYFLKSSLIAIFFISTLTSCLGLKDSFKIENGEDFAYITSVDGTKCAATSCGYVTSELINTLTFGECYLMAYIISRQDSRGLYIADECALIEEDPLRRFTVYDKEILVDDPAYHSFDINDIVVVAYDKFLYFDDNWLFKVSSKYNFNNSNVRTRFYYDKNNQFDESGNDISGTNKVIIDMDFSAKEGVIEDSKSNIYSFTVNMHNLRYIFSPNLSGQQTSGETTYVNVMIKFRFKHNNSDFYIGSWDGYNSYYMSFIIE